MRFANVEMAFGLWVVLLLILVFWLSAHRRHKRITQLWDQRLVGEINAQYSLRKLRMQQVCLLLGFVFSILALMRPQWGFEWREVKRMGLDIYVAVDASKSMLTSDVLPHRLERTKLAVKDLIKKLSGDRIGLIAFAGEAFRVCPLTVDYNGFLLSLNDLGVDTIPRGGTHLGNAIAEAIRAFEENPAEHKILIMITDGENLEGDPIQMALKAKAKGIKIYCIGIGTKEGDLIRVRNNVGEWEYLKGPDGNIVKSRLNEKWLQEIALLTGGIYVRSSGAQFGLDLIYDQELSQLEKREFEAQMEKKYYERFQIPLTLSILLILGESCLVPRKESFRL